MFIKNFDIFFHNGNYYFFKNIIGNSKFICSNISKFCTKKLNILEKVSNHPMLYETQYDYGVEFYPAIKKQIKLLEDMGKNIKDEKEWIKYFLDIFPSR